MARLLEIGGTNAAFATLLAVVVWAIARHWRQPAFVHLLWVLVLVKLITPPLVPIPWWTAAEAPVIELRVVDAGDAVPKSATKHIASANDALAGEDDATTIDVAMTNPPPVSKLATIPWTSCIGGLWLVGSVIWLDIAVGRLARFHFALADASLPSDDLRQLAAVVAAKVGVRRYRIRVTTARLSPLVWPIGRPTVVVPENLLDVLTEPELRAILTHEFAHLRRKDHWVRWLELAVTAIYWWHPVVWYVRRKIQQAEESACDAWVVRSNPAAAKEYATALFQAVQSATETLRPVPELASRVTSGGDLKERIEYVLNSTWNPEMSKWSRRSLSFLALCILPVSLTSVYALDAVTDAPSGSAQSTPVLPVADAPALEQNDRADRPVETSAPKNLDDLAALREHVVFLDNQFKKADALYRSGAAGGTADRWAMTGYELAKARGELAFAEGNRAVATARFAEAVDFAEQTLQAFDAAYQADRVTLDSLLMASKNLAEIKRRLIQLRRETEHATKGTFATKSDRDLRRELAQLPSSESNTPSLAYHRKAILLQKDRLARLQPLADKQVVTASELSQVKREIELGEASLRQAEHVLESRRLLVQLAEVELAQAVEANRSVPGAASELEVQRKKLMVDLARAKVREIEE